jgi:hypothetical protein
VKLAKRKLRVGSYLFGISNRVHPPGDESWLFQDGC